jgi:transposase-like protein
MVSMEEFVARFDSEETCIDYLFETKWPNGFFCPRCDHRHFYRIATRRLPLFECVQCSHQTSLTVGTVMEGSRTTLQKWFLTFFLVSQTSHGISALQLSKKIQVTYKTAWLMLQKIRYSMSEADASVFLSGIVHVNDASYARPPYSSIPKHPKEQVLLVGASMSGQQEPLYIKMKLLPQVDADTVILRGQREEFVEQHVESSTSPIEFITERYKPRRLKKLVPFFTQAKQWINQTFHGLGPCHLQAYFNEFCYRANLSLQNKPIFANLVRLCTDCKKITYTELTTSMLF